MTIKASKVKRNTKPSQVQAILGSRGRRYIYKEIPSSPIRGSSSRLQSKTPRTPRTPQHQQHGLDQVNLNEVGDDNGGDFPEFNIPKTKTQNDYLREWLPKRSAYLQRILMNEAPQPNQACKCGEAIQYKCLDCMGFPMLCRNCCRIEHRLLPFHRIERWNELYFQPAWLTEAGVMIHLGHGGNRCPGTNLSNTQDDEANEDVEPSDHDDEWEDDDSAILHDAPDTLRPPVGSVGGQADVEMSDDASDAPDAAMTIVDRSGVHNLGVRWCRCHGAEARDIQLLDMGLFPASFVNIKTCFTFKVLDDFRLDNLECKTSCLSFYRKLRRITSGAFPFMVPDRYRETNRITRIWQDLKGRKWHGFGHTNTEPGPGDLAVFCPTCPQPGVNLPQDWKEDPDQFKFRRTVVLDGNMKCVLEKPKRPDDDVYLTDGQAFFAEKAPYDAHVEIAIDIKGREVCNHHTAAEAGNLYRGLYKTGLGLAACGRHGAALPSSACDFQKGERQRNMDYSLSKALSYKSQGLPSALVMYDIMCQYGVHMEKRFDHSPYIDLPDGMEIYKGIGLFHVHGHKEDCFSKFAPNFIYGAGMVAGEIIESDWPFLNSVAPTTRFMTEAHRREVLDLHLNDLNFMKLLRSPAALVKKLKAASAGRAESAEALRELCAGNTRAQVSEWEELEERVRVGRLTNNDLMEVYDLKVEKAPTRAAIQNDLIKEELRAKRHQGMASWIATGLAIEEEQIKLASAVRRLPKRPTQKQALAINKRREKLQKKIDSWEVQAVPFYQGNELEDLLQSLGQAAEYDTGEEEEDDDDLFATRVSTREWKNAPKPEEAVLVLPSSFSRESLEEMDLVSLAEKEISLRVGQVNDTLHALRMTLAHKSVLYRTEVRHNANSQRKKGRAWGKVAAAESTIRHHARVYTRCRQAFHRLKADAAVTTKYKELKKEHLKAVTAVADPNARGTSKDLLPWFWNIGGEMDMGTQDSDFMRQMYTVYWLKAKALADRWDEEFKLVWSEMDWTLQYFQHEGRTWVARTEEAVSAGKVGHAAYAARQGSMWAKFYQQASTVFCQAKEAHPL